MRELWSIKRSSGRRIGARGRVSRSTIDLSECTLGPGVTSGPEGALAFVLAPDATVTSYDVALDAGEQEVVVWFRMGTWTKLPDITVHVWSEVGELLCSRRVSTRAYRAALRFAISVPVAAKLVIRSKFSSFDLLAIEYGPLLREDATAATHRARREQILAGLDLDPSIAPQQPLPEIPSVAEIESALFGSADIEIFSYDALPRHAETLQTIGLDLAALQSIFQQNNTPVDLDSEAPLSSERRLLSGRPKLSNRFQDELVRSARLSIPDPFTGETRETTNGYALDIVPVLATVVYEFTGSDPILVGTSLGWPGNVSFVWLIDRDVIIHQNLVGSDWVDPQQVICRYVASCLEYSAEVQRYRQSEHSPALVSGVIANLGHYFWNDVSGVEWLLRNEALGRVDAIYTTVNPWISLTEIFAGELPCPVVELSSSAEVFLRLVNDGRIPVRATATAVDRALALRVHGAAHRVAARDTTGLMERLNVAQSSSKFIFFVNLRVHNKVWLQQVEGVAALAERLDAQYGRDVLIYLDGYKDCDETVNDVRKAVAHLDVEIVDGTRASFSETLLWACACDLFIAVIGSGLALLTWLADKDGIAHSNIGHLSQLEWWGEVNVGSSATVLAPTAEHVRNVTSEYYSDYNISIPVFLGLLDSLMSRRMEVA